MTLSANGDQSSMPIMATPQTLPQRVWQLTRRVFGRPEFNKYAYTYNSSGQGLGISPSIPPELVELVHQSLDIEPELWETDSRVPWCDGAHNNELCVYINFQKGAHALNITHKGMNFGRIENWTAGLPGTWRHKLVQRIKNAHARAHKAYLYEQLGREQAKLELRNAGKTSPHLPKRVTDTPSVGAMTPGLNQGLMAGHIGRASRQKIMSDHSADALGYARLTEKATAIEMQIKQAEAAKQLQKIADKFGVGPDYANALFGEVAHHTMKMPKT